MTHWLLALLLLVGAIKRTGSACVSSPPDPTHIQVNGASAFQCWAVNPPFTISQQAGIVSAKVQNLGNITSSTVVFFNQTHDIDAGLHQGPDPQWVFVLQGSGVVTLPAGILTADVSKIGHETKWTARTVIIQMPFKNRVVPGHTITYPSGACPNSTTSGHPPQDPHRPHGGHSHLNGVVTGNG